MGTTLQNGVYLPNEGERNCYAGLKTNWEILDQKVADVTALQQAVAGALHREIVASLPTTDIDPNTIYMILSGTSATENVYNEFMYVNNSWELIGTSATDLTNYYTKGDVDGLLLLKANASDLTSHTGDTTIHVTSADKSKWNTVALIKQLRLVNAQVGSATTIAFANIDDTNGIKVGDKCMDLDGRMFEITAVDTTNQTVTVGSALIDLALDANVVHTSGTETVGGFKQFANIRVTNSIKGINLGDTTTDLNNCYSDFAPYRETKGGNIQYYYCNADSGTTNISNLPEAKAFFLTSITTRLISNSLYVKQILINSNNKTFTRYCNDGTWGSWVNETDKYVTIDTAQTISGGKTFSEDIVINNSDTSQTTKRLVITSSKVNLGDNNSDSWGISFNAGSSYVATINSEKSINSVQGLNFTVRTKDGNNNLISTSYRLRVYTDGSAYLIPSATDSISLGSSSNKWKDVQTNLVNGLAPSSMTLPNVNVNSFVDISGYFTNTGTGEYNTYPVTANGWIFLRLSTISSCQASVYDSNSNLLYGTSIQGGIEQILVPVVAGTTFQTQWSTASAVVVNTARFIPCLGNI